MHVPNSGGRKLIEPDFIQTVVPIVANNRLALHLRPAGRRT
jgi:hypothetical protein